MKCESQSNVAYQVNKSNRGTLLASLLAEVQETLAGLGRPCGVVIANLWFLATKVVGQILNFNGISAEPEETLLESCKLPTNIVSIE